MAGGSSAVAETRRRLGVPLTVLFGLLLLPAAAGQVVSLSAVADGEGGHSAVRGIEPSGIRWEEARVDLTGLRLG